MLDSLMFIDSGDMIMLIRKILPHISIVVLPLAITGVLHMLIVKANLFSFLKIPISDKAFGANKTWRGVIFVTLCNAFMLYVWYNLAHSTSPELNPETFAANRLLQGAILGLTYMLFELPNSYFKRRIGIKPGESSKKHKRLIQLLDKMDSAFGIALVYYLLSYGDLVTSILIFIIGSGIHMFISQVLYLLKIKKSY